MAETTYSYSISADFPGGAINTSTLRDEILASSIVTALSRIDTTGDTCDIVFKAALSAADKTTLDGDAVGPAGGLIAAHISTATVVDLVQLSSPSEPDGKPVVVQSPSTEGWMTWITSRGDDLAPVSPATGRGQGTQLKLSFTQVASKQLDLEFLEPVELHDGQFSWDPADWDCDDEFSLSAIIPATVATVNGTNTGNCNLSAHPDGYNVIVPAAGDGTHDVDLSAARAVVPAKDAGYWEADHDTGIVSASAKPGAAPWHLLDIQVESFFLRNVCMANVLGVFDIDVYKAEWISQAWKLRLKVVRNTTGAGSFVCGGWLMMFRENST